MKQILLAALAASLTTFPASAFSIQDLEAALCAKFGCTKQQPIEAVEISHESHDEPDLTDWPLPVGTEFREGDGYCVVENETTFSCVAN